MNQKEADGNCLGEGIFEGYSGKALDDQPTLLFFYHAIVFKNILVRLNHMILGDFKALKDVRETDIVGIAFGVQNHCSNKGSKRFLKSSQEIGLLSSLNLSSCTNHLEVSLLLRHVVKNGKKHCKSFDY